MLREKTIRPFRGVGVLQRWHAGFVALLGREQEDMLRRETEELRQQMLALATIVAELRTRQAGQPGPLPTALLEPLVEDSPNNDALHRFGRALERLSARLYWFEPWWIEGFLTVNSGFAAWVLLMRLQSLHGVSFQLAAGLWAEPRAWGVLALGASLANGLGLALTFPKARRGSLLLRLAGIAMSGMLWFALGLSALIGEPTNLFAMASVLSGLWAFWVLIRFPAVP